MPGLDVKKDLSFLGPVLKTGARIEADNPGRE
jgi:hypothetical protein